MENLPFELRELNLLTINCWGLLHVSPNRAERLAAIGRALASSSFPSNNEPPHIVALQECWTQEDYEAIRRETRFVLPYGKFYHSGIIGGGLAILSRWPIEESTMVRFPLNGRPTAFWRGDWYVGKGVACARIRYGRGAREVMEVFNTHTHAIYEHAPGADSYHVHRLSQAWELSKLLRGAAERGHLVLALGDFNDVPLSLTYRVLTAHAPVRDVWRVLHPDSALGAAEDALERARRRPIPTADHNIAENGVTSTSVLNTWEWPRAQRRLLGPGKDPVDVPGDSIDSRGKRIDYIFASAGVREGEQPRAGWVVKDARVGMVQRHPDLQCSLSDHFSVEATLVFHRADRASNQASSSSGAGAPGVTASGPDAGPRVVPTNSRPPSAAGSIESRDVNRGAFLDVQSRPASEYRLPQHDIQPSSAAEPGGRTGSRGVDGPSTYDAQLRLSALPVSRLPSSTYDEILGLVAAYTARQMFQRRWRGVHFLTWVFVAVVCYVGVWFAPPGVAFVLVLLASLGLVAGTIDGLIALLFVGSELRALREFEWEVRNARAVASGEGGAGRAAMGLGMQRNDGDGERAEKRW